MLFTLLLAFSLSVDAIGIGLSYGLRRIRFSSLSLLVLACESFCMMAFFLGLGQFLSGFFPVIYAEQISLGLLLLCGLWLCLQSKGIGHKKKEASPLHTPSLCDKNKSSVIEPKEALLLGFLLSIDSFAVGLSAAALNVRLLPLFSALFQTGFLFLGASLGARLILLSHPRESLWSLLSGGVLITIALLRFFG